MSKERRLMYIEFKGDSIVGPRHESAGSPSPSLVNRLTTMAVGSERSLALKATAGIQRRTRNTGSPAARRMVLMLSIRPRWKSTQMREKNIGLMFGTFPRIRPRLRLSVSVNTRSRLRAYPPGRRTLDAAEFGSLGYRRGIGKKLG